jgi:aryl-alcohol dehydrogenase-like predicted oxidoreductase
VATHALELDGPVQPSRIVFGAADTGSAVPPEKSFELLDRYVELGGNVLDTASLYARMYPGHEGTSEKTIGQWLRERKCRDKMIIVTKGGHRSTEPYSYGHCDRATLERHITTSLERLGVETIDLYFLHHDEPTRPVEDILDNLDMFRRRGWIRRVGASNWQADRLEAARASAEWTGVPGFCATELGYSLCVVPEEMAAKNEKNRMVFMGDALWEWHKKNDVPSLAYSSQARGFFGDENVAWAKAEFPGPAPRYPGYDCPENRTRLLAAIRVGQLLGATPNQVALAYLMHQPFPVYPIVATSRIERLEEAMASTRVVLPTAGVFPEFR